MTPEIQTKGEIILYQTSKGTPVIDVRLDSETVWLSLNQLSSLFDRHKSVVSRHIKKIFETKELERDSVVAFFATTGNDGKIYTVEHFNLDLIISVGYRVNSLRGTQFRIWANSVLKDFLVKGYTLNKSRLAQTQENFQRLETAVAIAKRAITGNPIEMEMSESVLELVHTYSHALSILSQYDLKTLSGKGSSSAHLYSLNIATARELVVAVKQELTTVNLASDLFGRERDDGLESCVASIYQTFGGEELYPTVEEKAAHLLYFVIKNHPFIDGNKRIGSMIFVHFLQRNNLLYNSDGTKRIAENALVAMALMIAESQPSERDAMLSVAVHLVKKENQ